MNPQPVIGVLFDHVLKHCGKLRGGCFNVSLLVPCADGFNWRQHDNPMLPGAMFSNQKYWNDWDIGGQC
jgi:hypothetical protein